MCGGKKGLHDCEELHHRQAYVTLPKNALLELSPLSTFPPVQLMDAVLYLFYQPAFKLSWTVPTLSALHLLKHCLHGPGSPVLQKDPLRARRVLSVRKQASSARLECPAFIFSSLCSKVVAALPGCCSAPLL